VILDYLRRQDVEAEKTTGDSSPRETHVDVRTGSVLSVAKRYNYDALHANHVAHLATQIFDQTINLHRLSGEERKLLEYGGLLHDIGYYISHEEHHLHGLYLIKNSEMPGFNSVEIAIIANMVRYLKGKMPKKDSDSQSLRKHREFFSLERTHRSTVQKLTAILRIADALDRSRRQAIKGVRCEQGSSGLIFHVECKDECDIELWMADLKSDLFQDVFRTSVRFEQQLHSHEPI
jgi:exopolyphosphatase/guanosine-5'-triphosphate,3'-diphosphate pyrophosphatase